MIQDFTIRQMLWCCVRELAFFSLNRGSIPYRHTFIVSCIFVCYFSCRIWHSLLQLVEPNRRPPLPHGNTREKTEKNVKNKSALHHARVCRFPATTQPRRLIRAFSKYKYSAKHPPSSLAISLLPHIHHRVRKKHLAATIGDTDLLVASFSALFYLQISPRDTFRHGQEGHRLWWR